MSSADKRTPPHVLRGPEQKKARGSSEGNAEFDTSPEKRKYGSVTEEVKNALESKLLKFKFLSKALGVEKKPLEEETPKVDKLSTSLPGQHKDSDTGAVDIGRTKTTPIINSKDEETNPWTPFSESAIDHQIKGSVETSRAQNQSLREEGDGDAAETRLDRRAYVETSFAGNKSLREEGYGGACYGGELVAETQADMEISDDETPHGRETEEYEANDQIVLVDNDDINPHGQMEDENEVGEVVEDEENGQIGYDGDNLEDIWNEMNYSLECSKVDDDIQPEKQVQAKIPDCDHSFVLKEDIGSVCRVCGLIERQIQDIIEYQYVEKTRSTRTYYREAGISTDKEAHELINRSSNLSDLDIPIEGLAIHPMHRKQMKPHQLEGFKFLLNNLVSDNPGGCILAHAPGSGKTFMIISFMQSFLAKYPEAKPLVVLPKGILSSWKKEFTRWQVEDIPLYDFYSVKADSRAQQLEVLNKWIDHRSILFLGYKQFSSIICDYDSNEIAATCQKILLEYPSILILDGHTPRNKETDVLSSLKLVQTSRKVVLSGTLYQNHVKEVFNIFDLVRPKFLRQKSSRTIMRRVLSRVQCSRKDYMENVFFDSVESTLQKDEDFKRKITIIRDLREMTTKVLHFYKGDFLDELPGHEEFTVFLNLSPKQKEGVNELKQMTQRFKINSKGSALYVHPELRKHLNTSTKKEREGLDFGKMDAVIEKSEIRDGVKANFFFNLLDLCETTQEKLLVFSQYIQPLKFLERLVIKKKNWSVGKEIFVITGDSSSDSRDSYVEQFNNSPSSRLFFGSIKACGEGISLVGGSRIIILDVHLNPSVTRQAIGRAFRPGQEKKVYTYRLVAAESPEEYDHATCYRKESIAKMWFEWNEWCRENEFEMRSVDVKDCGDEFLESPKLSSDVKSLYKR